MKSGRMRPLALAFCLAVLAASAAIGSARPVKKPRPAPKPAPTIQPAEPVVADSLERIAAALDSLARSLADSAVRAHGGLSTWREVRDLEFTRNITQHGREGATRSTTAVHRLRVGPGPWSLRLDTRLESGARLVCVTSPETTWAAQDGERLDNRRAITFAPIQMELDRTLLRMPWALVDPEARIFTAADTARPGERILDCTLSSGPEMWRVGLDVRSLRVGSVAWWHQDFGVGPPEYRVLESDYVEVSGLQFPGRQDIYDARSGRLLAEHVLTGYRVNVGFPDSFFRKP